jgi:hypothetical protein
MLAPLGEVCGVQGDYDILKVIRYVCFFSRLKVRFFNRLIIKK